MYLDYWWFYVENPSPLEKRGFCAAGFRLPGITCFDHDSDWEGVTVVLERCTRGEACVDASAGSFKPVAVHYAQHRHVISYDWPGLQRRWKKLPPSVKRQADQAGPLVFVARNSHASYPNDGDRITDGPFDGQLAWTNNASCGACLKPLPVTSDDEPALWNAFTGPWGRQHCILWGTYCDRSGAPTAPSTQKRYADPTGAAD